MKLLSFSVSKYRSITTANKLPIRDFTVLIGPNNEGKSNVLKAFVIALRILQAYGQERLMGSSRLAREISRNYDWECDYPVSLQNSQLKGKSVFTLEFALLADELTEFRNVIKSQLTSSLPIEITIDRQYEVVFKVKVRGRAAKAMSQKARRIAAFIGEKLDFEYIPAVRTVSSAVEIVENMVARELSRLEEDPEYQEVLAKIENLQKPILDNIAGSIRSTLTDFLPDVRDVQVSMSKEKRYRAFRRACEIAVDDGVLTNLEQKGDGVKSLAALSLMRQASEKSAQGRQLILAVEEPESHLHPNAIHGLKNVLQDMSSKHQVLVSTHCPLFVERRDIKANIIVADKKAKPAKNISEIRAILGVQASDNLSNAELVLLVEGETDCSALTALLANENVSLKKALADGTLVLDSLAGGSNLSYKLSLLRNSICTAHCFLDNDQSGNQAIEKAENVGLLSTLDYTLANCPGMQESELEDFYTVNLYKQIIMNRFGVNLTSTINKTSPKWSLRVKKLFQEQGKRWTTSMEKKVKSCVADAVEQSPANALNPNRRSSFDALINVLLEKLNKS
jgi:putative ATP-dependent endonuclease of OLD family